MKDYWLFLNGSGFDESGRAQCDRVNFRPDSKFGTDTILRVPCEAELPSLCALHKSYLSETEPNPFRFEFR